MPGNYQHQLPLQIYGDSCSYDGSPTSTVLLVNDWEDCSKANAKCRVSTSTCVKHSDYFSQCMPATLPTGGLCGQVDGTNNWKYYHCITGETCKANGKDSHCTK